MSSKYLNFLDFKRMVDYKNSSKITSNLSPRFISDLKSGKNNKRTYFNWDHLYNFYCQFKV